MRYIKLPKHKGIYDDTKTGNFFCQKRINKKLYNETFKSLREATHWVKSFHPNNVSFQKMSIQDLEDINGRIAIKVSGVWEKYKAEHVSCLEITSQEHYDKCLPFFGPIMKNDVRNITPQVISRLVSHNKTEYIKSGKDKRFGFGQELKCLKAMFSWWHDHYDYKFVCPVVKKVHWPMGVIKKKKLRVKEKMPIDVVSSFLSEMYRLGSEDSIYAMLAETQFITMSRIQETSCIQDNQVDFKNHILTIDKAMAFTKKKGSENYVKGTKTEEVKILKTTEKMENIFLTLINRKPDDCDFLFQINGKALSYRQIQYHYNRALISLGLYPTFSSTHIMRHAAAFNVRQSLSLDHTQAMGGWKSTRIAEHYSGLSNDLASEGVIELEKRLSIVK